MPVTQLIYQKETDSYQAIVGNERITVSREAFDKAVHAQVEEYKKGGMAEIPDAYVMARDFLLVAEYWISSTMADVRVAPRYRVEHGGCLGC